MQKPFYVSGFLYHSSSQQILLQQLSNKDGTHFALFRKKSVNGDDPITVFHQCIEGELGEKVSLSAIYPVYDYVHESLGEHYIFFAEVSGNSLKKYEKEDTSQWMPFSKFEKYPMGSQTKHDITIGQRVIRSRQEGTTSH